MTNWRSCTDVAIVLTIVIFCELEFHVYVHKTVCIVMAPVIVFDLSRVNKFIINHHETSINMLHTRYIVSFATR